jgi:glycosyltransferase involved in cell wall biosynthesis
MEQSLVSVLMPAYNCSRFISQAIDCILTQTHTNLELIIADDASTDDTRKIIDSYNDSRIRLFHNSKNLGYLKTWNKLIKEAKGDYITFLDGDDTCAKNRIEVLLSAFTNDPSLGAVGSNYNRINEQGAITFTSSLELAYEVIKESMPQGYHVVGSAIMIKKEVYENIGGYNEYFSRIGAEDFYWIWLIMEKYKLINLAMPLYNYRSNSNSVSGNMTDNHRKLLSGKILAHLIESRRKTGTDLLADGKEDELEQLVAIWEEPFKKDPAHLYTLLAHRYFYMNQTPLAIKMAWKAVWIGGFNFKNLRDFIYYTRKSILK